MTFSATYSPDDNKIRLYASSKLDPETYARVRAAGFIWAPKQELFVAPCWTPEREDIAIELAGEIDDEDKSLVARAEERSERFEGYSERRAADATGALAAVEQVSKRFEFGQPILVGHHSEKRARKDAERIETGMRKAVKMWKTSTYWTERAAGAIGAAKYKEQPAVRARRIKTIEAEKRKSERSLEGSRAALKLWAREPMTTELAKTITADGRWGYVSFKFPLADYPRLPPASQYEGDMSPWSALDGGLINGEQARALVVPRYERSIERAQRWVDHCDNRLAYERAMLAEAGGLVADRFDFQVGGQVLRRHGAWFFIKKVNRKDGAVTSVSVLGHFAATIGVDEIRDYRAPTEGVAEKVKAANDKGPMCNYPGLGFVHMTQAEWKAVPRWSDCSYTENHKATETTGRHRTRRKPAAGGGGWKHVGVYLTDVKQTDPPAVAAAVALPALPPTPAPRERAPVPAPALDAAPFEALARQLKTGVKVVSAPQLLPTPAALAERMVKAAGIRSGDTVLEPSAGTGALLRALGSVDDVTPLGKVVAVEINAELARTIEGTVWADKVVCADFAALGADELGGFDRIVMNPPFSNGADVAHIMHAMTMLNPGGRLVALCADGPRQREQLKPGIEEMGGTWETLPAGSFKESGTGVLVAMIVVDAPPATCGKGEAAGAHLPLCRPCRAAFLMSQGRAVSA